MEGLPEEVSFRLESEDEVQAPGVGEGSKEGTANAKPKVTNSVCFCGNVRKVARDEGRSGY